MYNRSQTGQSISEFIKEKINEDEEDRESQSDSAATGAASASAAASNDDSLTNEIKALDVSKPGAASANNSATSQQQQQAAPVKFRIDDDFLFQMDKGRTLLIFGS